MYRLILVILIILSLNTYSQSYLGLSRFDIQLYLEKDNNDYKVKTNGSTVYILYYVNDLGIAYYFNENNVCILCLYMCQYGSMEYTSIMKQLSEKFITSVKTGVYDENCVIWIISL